MTDPNSPASIDNADVAAPMLAYADPDAVAKIKAALKENGPMVGQALLDKIEGFSPIALWRICYYSRAFRIRNCARYYLRYDIKRGNELRLSPSILRDFLTFSLIYLPTQSVESVEAGTRLANQFRTISLRKLGLARRALLQLDPELQKTLIEHCVVFLSGDIAYYLAHDTPRKHPELGTPIRGSDLDIVCITNREADPDVIRRIESQLLTVKKLYLLTPSIREEMDFIVKPIERMLDQLSYVDIHEKIASKILYESYFLMGRVDIYDSLIKHLEISGARAKIERDFEIALIERKETISKIRALPPSDSVKDSEVASLFFASQERLEFR